MPGIVDTLLFRFIGNTQHLLTNIASAKTALRGLTGSVFSAKGAIVGGLTAIGVAALIAFRKSVAAIAGLDAGLREVSTLLPGTIDGLNGVRNVLIDLSARVGEPPEMLSKAFYQSVSAGFTNLADSLQITEVSAKAAVAGLTDTETALDGITTVLNAYGLSANDAAKVSDVLFSTVAEGKIRFGELSSNIGTVASTAKIIGIDIEEVSAAIASLTKNTGQVEESFTALNRLLIGFAKNTDEAREFASALGLELDANTVRQKDLLTVLEEIAEAAGDDAEAFAKLFPNLRQFKGVVTLATEGLDDYKKALDRAQNSAGATERAFNKVQGGLDQQKKILGQTVNKLWLRLGTVTLPIAIAAYESLNKELLQIFDKEELRIQRLERLGRLDEANALRKIQLELEFQKQLDKTLEKQTKQLSNLARRLFYIEKVSQFLVEPLVFGEADRQQKQFREGLSTVRKFLEQIGRAEFTNLSIEQKRARVQVAINNLVAAEDGLREDQVEYLQSFQAILQDVLASLEDEVKLEETLRRIREGLPLVDYDDGSGGGGTRVADDAEDAVKRLEAATQSVREFNEQLQLLREFGLELGDEVPDAVQTYIDALTQIDEQLEQQLADTLELVQQGELKRARAGLENVRALRAQREELLASKDAIIDAIRLVDEFGSDIVELYATISDEQREFIDPWFDQFAQALEDLRRAQDAVDLATEGTAAFEEAIEAEEEAARAAEVAFESLKRQLRIIIPNLKEFQRISAFLEKLFSKPPKGDPFNWKKTGELIESSARAALSLADALGIVDDKTRQVLQGFIDIGDAIAKIASGNILAGAIQGVGGFVGVLSGIFGGGPDPETVARIEAAQKAYEEAAKAIRENSDTLERLNSGIDNLTAQLSDIPAKLTTTVAGIFTEPFEEFEKTLREIREDARSADEEDRPGFEDEIDRARQRLVRQIRDAFEESGLSIEELKEVAKATGLELDALIGFLETGEGDFEQLAIQAEQLSDALKLIDFEALFEGWDGFLRRLELEFQILDLDDPAEKLRLMVEEFNRLTDLPEEFQKRLDKIDLDNLTPEALAELEALLQEIFKESLDNPEFIAALDELSPEDWIDAISALTDGIDGLQEATEGIEDGSQNVSAQNRITTEQAERQGAILSTISGYNRLIYDELKLFHTDFNAAFGLVSPSESQVGAFVGQGVGASAGVINNIDNLNITVEEARTPEETLNAIVGGIDAQLGSEVIAARSGVSGFAYRRNI